MNTLTNKISTGAIALAVFAMFAFGIAPLAHAADEYGDEYSGGSGYSDQYAGGYGYSDQYSGGLGYTDQYSGGNGYLDQYSGGNGYTDQYSGGNGYASGFGGSSGFGGFGGGGFSFGGGGFGGGSSVYAPSTATAFNNGNTYTYAPTNTNTCTGGNVCNSIVDDHSIFNAPTTVTVSGGGSNSSYPVYTPVPVYQPQPIVYQQPVYQPTYQPVYTQPTYHAPYVSLSQVPYTGLDLGPIGTALYWSFLVLWCLLAAYLVAVKKVQNKIVSALNGFLFPAATHAKHTARVYNVHAPKAHAEVVVKESGIDSFITSQINRSR